MNKQDLINNLDEIANEIESQDKDIALAIDQVTDKIEKRAFFNQSTWLPGRTTRNYPNTEQKEIRTKPVIFICSKCKHKKYGSFYKKCPICGGFMYKIS